MDEAEEFMLLSIRSYEEIKKDLTRSKEEICILSNSLQKRVEENTSLIKTSKETQEQLTM